MDRQAKESAPQFPPEASGEAPEHRHRALGRRGAPPAGDQEPRLAGLADAVRDEIVPRLVGGHRPQREPTVLHLVPTVTHDDVAGFAQIALDGTTFDAMAFVERLRGQGVSLEAIYLELLEPSARALGTMWESDVCDFTAVTLGIGRIQQVLRELSPEFRSELECAWHGRRLLLAPAPGEQHTFGLFVVADFFARAGWDVWGGTAIRDGDLFRLVRDERFDIVGLSLGCAGRLDLLTSNISALRSASRNRDVRVLVGGPLFISRPENARDVGADGTAAGARQALATAERMLAASGSHG